MTALVLFGLLGGAFTVLFGLWLTLWSFTMSRAPSREEGFERSFEDEEGGR